MYSALLTAVLAPSSTTPDAALSSGGAAFVPDNESAPGATTPTVPPDPTQPSVPPSAPAPPLAPNTDLSAVQSGTQEGSMDLSVIITTPAGLIDSGGSAPGAGGIVSGSNAVPGGTDTNDGGPRVGSSTGATSALGLIMTPVGFLMVAAALALAWWLWRRA